MPNITGVDVSSHQPGWKPGPTDKFVFVKATEGTSYTNPEHDDQIAAGRSGNLAVGHYHFLHPGDAVDQARYFVRQADARPGDLMVCDWEDTPEGHPSVEDAALFIAEVKRLLPTWRVGLYCNRSDWLNTAVKAGDFLWLAEYGIATPAVASWDFWQWTDEPIDQNRSRFPTLASLKAWAGGRPSIDTATVTHFADLPIDTAYKSRALWQGAAYAKNPLTGAEYLFQLQAQQLDEGDVEDTWIHRYSLKGSVPTYLDSMRGRRFGHCQTVHVRISALGNTRLWLGVETYDAKLKKTGTKVWQVLYRKGEIRRSDKHRYIYTGKGSAAPIPSPAGYVWLRRPSDPEVYEKHREKDLLAHRSTIDRPKPLLTIKAPRADGTYQGACGSADTVYRVNGATEQPSILSAFTVDGQVGRLDVTAAASPAAGKVTSEEPEGVFYLRGKLTVGKRFNSVRRRVVALFTVASS